MTTWVLPLARTTAKRRFREAIATFWATPKKDRRSGRQMKGFAQLLCDCLQPLGIRAENLETRSPRLPGYFRAAKQWDLALRSENGTPIAMVELKSIVTAFGKNLNNRIEEALGSAVDSRELFDSLGIDPTSVFRGYLIVVGESKESERVRKKQSLFVNLGDGSFIGKNGVDSVKLACKRLVQSRHYERAAVLISRMPAHDETAHYTPESAFDEFVSLASALYIHAKTQSEVHHVDAGRDVRG